MWALNSAGSSSAPAVVGPLFSEWRAPPWRLSKVLNGVTLEPPATGAALVVASGHQAGTRYAIASTRLTVGRHPDSDIFLDDITVSRRHVELEQGSAGYLLKDVGSLNGTYLNGERLSDGETPLTNGDELQIGKFKLLYLVSSTI